MIEWTLLLWCELVLCGLPFLRLDFCLVFWDGLYMLDLRPVLSFSKHLLYSARLFFLAAEMLCLEETSLFIIDVFS